MVNHEFWSLFFFKKIFQFLNFLIPHINRIDNSILGSILKVEIFILLLKIRFDSNSIHFDQIRTNGSNMPN
jgi:hypothetical protein